MIKALCSCGFCGNLEDLKIATPHEGSKNRLICPECELSIGLDFAEEGVAVSKGHKDIAVSKDGGGEEKNLTSQEDFELFKKCVMYWVGQFGLYGWDIRLLHQEDEDSIAYARYNVPNRLVSIILAKNWDDKVVTDVQIDKAAFHEVGELLMMRLRFIAESRFITEEEIGEEIHGIIRILENVVWIPKVKDFSNIVHAAVEMHSEDA